MMIDCAKCYSDFLSKAPRLSELPGEKERERDKIKQKAFTGEKIPSSNKDIRGCFGWRDFTNSERTPRLENTSSAGSGSGYWQKSLEFSP
jgi:hypothetical protein